jgi:hypothetical protein
MLVGPFKLPSMLGCRPTLVDHGEQGNYLRHPIRETQGRAGRSG